MSFQLRIDRLVEKNNDLFYSADCGHTINLSKGELPKQLYDEILCEECYSKEIKVIEEFQERNPIGAPTDLTHPYKK